MGAASNSVSQEKTRDRFDLTRVRDSVGLQNMRDRVGAVGGRVEIFSERGRGTEVFATAPIAARVSRTAE